MKKSALSIPFRWVPIERSEAVRRNLTFKKLAHTRQAKGGIEGYEEFKGRLAPRYNANELVLALDRSVWFETSMAPRWTVAFRLANQRGQPVIAEVRVFPGEPDAPHFQRAPGQWSGEYGVTTRVPPGGLSMRALKQVRTGVFRADLRRIMTCWAEELKGLAPSAVPPLAACGRKGRSDHELARIASAYERAYVAARPAIAAVAKAFRLSLSRARDAVSRARVRGLLSPASKQGKGGGLLTPLAHELLK